MLTSLSSEEKFSPNEREIFTATIHHIDLLDLFIQKKKSVRKKQITSIMRN